MITNLIFWLVVYVVSHFSIMKWHEQVEEEYNKTGNRETEFIWGGRLKKWYAAIWVVVILLKFLL